MIPVFRGISHKNALVARWSETKGSFSIKKRWCFWSTVFPKISLYWNKFIPTGADGCSMEHAVSLSVFLKTWSECHAHNSGWSRNAGPARARLQGSLYWKTGKCLPDIAVITENNDIINSVAADTGSTVWAASPLPLLTIELLGRYDCVNYMKN